MTDTLTHDPSDLGPPCPACGAEPQLEADDLAHVYDQDGCEVAKRIRKMVDDGETTVIIDQKGGGDACHQSKANRTPRLPSREKPIRTSDLDEAGPR